MAVDLDARLKRSSGFRAASTIWPMQIPRPDGRTPPSIAAVDPTPLVFVVDDDNSVRESLELLIRTTGWQVETYASAQAFLACARPPVPSCLVLDVSLPDLTGLDLQKRLGDQHSDLPIIFITGHGDISMSVRAMKAGAVEFLTKPFNAEKLLAGIAGAIERSRAILRREAEFQILRDRYATLSPREREVMALVVAGLLNKQIAGELGISEITVKAHRGKLMRKMRAGSLPELVKMAPMLGASMAAPGVVSVARDALRAEPPHAFR